VITVGELKRPEQNVFISQKKFSEAQSSMDKVGLMPKLGILGAGVMFSPAIQFGPSDLSSIALVGLNLSWNTSGLDKMKNNSELHKLNLQKINLQEEQFVFNTKLQLTQNKTDVDKKYALLSKDDEMVELRTTIRNAYQKKFDNGLCPVLDLITATEKETEAKANKALHKIEWLHSSYNYSTTNGN